MENSLKQVCFALSSVSCKPNSKILEVHWRFLSITTTLKRSSFYPLLTPSALNMRKSCEHEDKKDYTIIVWVLAVAICIIPTWPSHKEHNLKLLMYNFLAHMSESWWRGWLFIITRCNGFSISRIAPVCRLLCTLTGLKRCCNLKNIQAQ